MEKYRYQSLISLNYKNVTFGTLLFVAATENVYFTILDMGL